MNKSARNFDTLCALGAERARLLDDLKAVNAKIRPVALAAIADDMPKKTVALAGAITRPTLDKWIAQDER